MPLPYDGAPHDLPDCGFSGGVLYYTNKPTIGRRCHVLFILARIHPLPVSRRRHAGVHLLRRGAGVPAAGPDDFWCVSKEEGYYLLFVGFFGTVLNQFLKLLCRIPRPWVLDPNFTIVESARAAATGYSFPSGHTQNAVGTFGAMALRTERKWVRGVCIALIVLVHAFDLLGLDRKGILAVTMPCFGTTARTRGNAEKLADAYGVTLQTVDIKAAVLQHFSDIGHDPEQHDVTYENGQARERTQILMDIANQTEGFVVGTGDMSELALGWATYNGDHMSMYGVNCSVPKMLVRHLVRYYADTCGEKELSDILLDVLDTPVSPELLPPEEDGKIAQKTEDLVGPYELHDFYLYYILRFGYRPGKIYRLARQAFDGAYDKETILKWLKVFYRRFFNQQFKRSCLPDGPKVGSAAVSPRGDLRMPSDACSRLWLEELETLDEDCVYGVPETKAAGGSL